MRLESYSCYDTVKIGHCLAKGLRRGDIVCLFGQLGSGKTILTKGIAQGIGLKKEEISSPSFVLIRQYHQAEIPLYHFDLYRLRSPQDIQDLGYEEYFFGEGITVVEWADRLQYLMPKEYLRIDLDVKGENRRQIEMRAFGRRYQEIIKELKGFRNKVAG